MRVIIVQLEKLDVEFGIGCSGPVVDRQIEWSNTAADLDLLKYYHAACSSRIPNEINSQPTSLTLSILAYIRRHVTLALTLEMCSYHHYAGAGGRCWLLDHPLMQLADEILLSESCDVGTSRDNAYICSLQRSSQCKNASKPVGNSKFAEVISISTGQHPNQADS